MSADLMAARWRGDVDASDKDGLWASNSDPDKAKAEARHWVVVSDLAAKRMDIHLQVCKDCNVMALEPKFKYGDLVQVAGVGTVGRIVNVAPPAGQALAFMYQVAGASGFSFVAEGELSLSDDLLQKLIYEMYGEARKYPGAVQAKELKRGLRLEMQVTPKDTGEAAHDFGMRISRADDVPSRAEWDTCFVRLPIAYDADEAPRSFSKAGRNYLSRKWDFIFSADGKSKADE